MFESRASRLSKCVPHCQGDKNSVLDEIFQSPWRLCESGALAPPLSLAGEALKARALFHGISATQERRVTDVSINYKTDAEISKISMQPKRRRKIGAGQKPPGSAKRVNARSQAATGGF